MIKKLIIEKKYMKILGNIQNIIFFLETAPIENETDAIVLANKSLDIVVLFHSKSIDNKDVVLELKKMLLSNYNLLIKFIGSQEILDNYLEEASKDKYEYWLLNFLIRNLTP